jgi:hypothetical protein
VRSSNRPAAMLTRDQCLNQADRLLEIAGDAGSSSVREYYERIALHLR